MTSSPAGLAVARLASALVSCARFFSQLTHHASSGAAIRPGRVLCLWRRRRLCQRCSRTLSPFLFGDSTTRFSHFVSPVWRLALFATLFSPEGPLE